MHGKPTCRATWKGTNGGRGGAGSVRGGTLHPSMVARGKETRERCIVSMGAQWKDAREPLALPSSGCMLEGRTKRCARPRGKGLQRNQGRGDRLAFRCPQWGARGETHGGERGPVPLGGQPIKGLAGAMHPSMSACEGTHRKRFRPSEGHKAIEEQAGKKILCPSRSLAQGWTNQSERCSFGREPLKSLSERSGPCDGRGR